MSIQQLLFIHMHGNARLDAHIVQSVGRVGNVVAQTIAIRAWPLIALSLLRAFSNKQLLY